MKNPKAKIGKVMREFHSGTLRSSSGAKVTNPAQAKAIGLSEARRAGARIPFPAARVKKIVAETMRRR